VFVVAAILLAAGIWTHSVLLLGIAAVIALVKGLLMLTAAAQNPQQ
jgi:hypothetical protein